MLTLRIRDSSPPRYITYRTDTQRLGTTPAHRRASHFYTHAAANQIAGLARKPVDVEACECTLEYLAPIARL